MVKIESGLEEDPEGLLCFFFSAVFKVIVLPLIGLDQAKLTRSNANKSNSEETKKNSVAPNATDRPACLRKLSPL